MWLYLFLSGGLGSFPRTGGRPERLPPILLHVGRSDQPSSPLPELDWQDANAPFGLLADRFAG